MLCEGIELEQSGPVVTVRIAVPELTHTQMQELVDECLERMRCHNASFFAFDMSDVTFLASACLGLLVSLLQDLEHVRGRIALANCQQNVAFLFKVTRLDAVFPIYEDVRDAVESF